MLGKGTRFGNKNIKEIAMKTILFENVWSKEKFECSALDIKNPEIIEGVEYLRVSRVGTGRVFLMRKDALKKIKENSFLG